MGPPGMRTRGLTSFLRRGTGLGRTMAKADQLEIPLRIVIENPVPSVLHSLQSKDGHPLDPNRSSAGERLALAFPIRIAPGPKVFGDQVRRVGPHRLLLSSNVSDY